MSFADADALASEFETNLRHGRAFIRSELEVEVLSECVLVLEHPDAERTLELGAQVVMVGGGGIGIELRPADEATVSKIGEFVEGNTAGDGSSEDERRPTVPPEARPSTAPGRHSTIPPDVQTLSRQQQIRAMSMAEQLKLARTGELSDRVMLERTLGKGAWDALLSNPRLTVPEVATIARKGTVPKNLLDQIADNATWARASPVRRALMSNPRVSKDAIRKLLASTPKPELKLIAKGTAYAAHIRDAAKKLIT